MADFRDQQVEPRNACSMRRKTYTDSTVISASDARERSDNSSKLRVEEELLEVYGEVYDASGKGNYEANIYKKLSNKALERLTELGYKYEPIGKNSMDEGFRQTGFKISWK